MADVWQAALFLRVYSQAGFAKYFVVCNECKFNFSMTFHIEQDVTNRMSSFIILTLVMRHIIKIFFNTSQWRIGSLSVIFNGTFTSII